MVLNNGFQGLAHYFRKWILKDPAVVTDRADGAAEFRDYVESIDRFNASQPNTAMLEEIRAYNHLVIFEFDRISPLAGACVLDIGASPHGYGMEKCFNVGVARYVGIGLDIETDQNWRIGDSEGRLLYMNAQHLDFADCTFDAVISMSTFEHIADVPKALSEIRRVLRPGGKVLLSFEPLWTCAYGHHLHHYGEVSNVVPSWAHLVWDRKQMAADLEHKWPVDAAISLGEAIEWIYDSDGINRVGISKMREYLNACGMRVEWIVPMTHESSDYLLLREAQVVSGLPVEDLHTKGLSVLMSKDVH